MDDDEILNEQELPKIDEIKKPKRIYKKKIIEEPVIEVKEEEEQVIEVINLPKKKGSSRERMIELNEIKKKKALAKMELKKKEEEIIKIKTEKIEYEYIQAQKLKDALEAKKTKKPEIKQQEEKEKNILYKTASRDILKEKYLEEAKRRVMMDLFSS